MEQQKSTGVIQQEPTEVNRSHTTGTNRSHKAAQLMQYFKKADPDDMSQGALSKRVCYLKREERGYEEMCEVAERIYNQGIEMGIERGIKQGTENKAKQMTIL